MFRVYGGEKRVREVERVERIDGVKVSIKLKKKTLGQDPVD